MTERDEQMFTIRKETAADIAAIKEVNDAAFSQKNEANFIHEIRQSESFEKGLSLVAENEEVPSLALAPMAVKPGFQKEGVGSLLVRADWSTAENGVMIPSSFLDIRSFILSLVLFLQAVKELRRRLRFRMRCLC